MNRKKNVDYLRAIAILIIVVYHCYVLCGNPWSMHVRINSLLSFGGEVGVTLFFVLSGFGIFCSLYSKEKENKMPNWRMFMKQRCIRIMPQYYACIVMCLIFHSTSLIAKNGIRHIVAYITFTQNFRTDTHASINGALWAIATIFQFYLIALFLYKLVQKKWVLAVAVSVGITVISKILIYQYFIPKAGLDGSAYFVYGRQLVSAIDNFVFGMAAAKIVLLLQEKKKERKTKLNVICVIISLIMLVVVSYYLANKGIYGVGLTAYVGHSVLAFILASLIVSVSMLPEGENIVFRPLEFLAKYQYGMYLWHMPVIMFLCNYAPLFSELLEKSFILFTCGILIVVGIIGYYSSIWITVKGK